MFPFLHVFCWHSFWKKIIPHCRKQNTSLITCVIKKVVSRQLFFPTQTQFILEDNICISFYHMTLTNDHLVNILQYHPYIIGSFECESLWSLPQPVLMDITMQKNIINIRNNNILYSVTHPRLVYNYPHQTTLWFSPSLMIPACFISGNSNKNLFCKRIHIVH